MKSDFRLGMDMEREDIADAALANIRFVLKMTIKGIKLAHSHGQYTEKLCDYKYANICGHLASCNAIGLITNRQYVFYMNIIAKIAYGTAAVRDNYYDIKY